LRELSASAQSAPKKPHLKKLWTHLLVTPCNLYNECMFQTKNLGYRSSLRAISIVAAFALCTSTKALAATSCNSSGPYLQNLFLSGQKFSDMIHEQALKTPELQANAAPTARSLSVLGHALSKLNTSIWGLYWVNIYSRRLHEVLDQLDSKPPGPVTQYYDRWDSSQVVSSAAMLKRDLDSVNKLLPQTPGVSAEQKEMLQQFLRQIENELEGCTAPNSRPG
jgi:hypothetical protein